jgi:hypothetical protein
MYPRVWDTQYSKVQLPLFSGRSRQEPGGALDGAARDLIGWLLKPTAVQLIEV